MLKVTYLLIAFFVGQDGEPQYAVRSPVHYSSMEQCKAAIDKEVDTKSVQDVDGNPLAIVKGCVEDPDSLVSKTEH